MCAADSRAWQVAAVSPAYCGLVKGEPLRAAGETMRSHLRANDDTFFKSLCKSLLYSKQPSHSWEARRSIQNRAQLLSKTKHFVRRASGWLLYLSLTNPKIPNPKSEPAKPGDVTHLTPSHSGELQSRIPSNLPRTTHFQLSSYNYYCRF